MKDREVIIFLYNLVYLRRKHGLSKRAMAAKLSIGIHSWNLIESGRLPPRLSANIFYAILQNFSVYPSAMVSQKLDETG